MKMSETGVEKGSRSGTGMEGVKSAFRKEKMGLTWTGSQTESEDFKCKRHPSNNTKDKVEVCKY